MKKCFFVTLGITCGLGLIFAILGGGIYWWDQVRVPAPPTISVKLDGFLDVDNEANNERKSVIRIVITNNGKNRLDFDDAYLYLTRFDGARTNIKDKIDDFILYPNDKYVAIVRVATFHNEGIKCKNADDFKSKEEFLAHREMWISQLKETFGANYTFLSDNHNIRILLDVEKELVKIESELTDKTNREWMKKHESKAQESSKAVDVTIDKKIKTLRLEAERGDAVAQFNLGISYAKGEGLPKDPAEAVKWCRKAAEQGYAKAQFNLGVCYSSGLGVPKDAAEAVKWYRKAAEQGYVDAQYNMGVCYYKGEGVAKNDVEAVMWFRNAAEQGYAKAQYNLGICYAKGEGVAKNDAEAVKWYRKAAEQGDVDAQYDLGVCYAKGEGVPKDAAESVKWCRKAAEQGDAVAQYNLGICYAKGEGVAKNDAEAVKWYRKAAEQGDVDAQYDLGICYAKGEGLPKDDVVAYMWFKLASTKGDNDAVKKMEIISERMTDEQITQALNLSSEWIESHKK
jgi:TPR repeat protein